MQFKRPFSSMSGSRMNEKRVILVTSIFWTMPACLQALTLLPAHGCIQGITECIGASYILGSLEKVHVLGPFIMKRTTGENGMPHFPKGIIV